MFHVKYNEFTCGICKKTYLKKRTDEEAMKDAKAHPWNWIEPDDEFIEICEECLKGFKVWYYNLSDEEHNRMVSVIRNN